MAGQSLPLLTLCTAAPLLAAAAGSAHAQAQAQERLPVVTVLARPAPALEPSGFAEFGDLPLGELPLAMSVLRSRELRDEGVISLSDAIRRDPSASDAYNTIGYVESVQVRGFLLDGLLNHRRNGLPLSSFTPFNMATKQDIAILKGAAGPVSGTGSPGGALNFLTKPATIDITELSLDASERGSLMAAIDLGRKLPALAGGDFGVRINAALWTREPAARDADGRGSVLAAALDWRGRGGVRADLEFEVQNSRQVSVPGFGLLDREGDGVAETLPPPIDPRLNLNNQPWTQPFDNRSRVGSARLALPLAPHWTLTFSGLAQRIVTHDRVAFPDGCSAGAAYVYPGLCGNYDVDLYDYRNDNERRSTRVVDVALDGTLRLGGVTHRLRLAPRSTRYSERNQPLQAFNFVGTINALAPVPLAPDPTPTVLNTDRDLRIDDLALSDTIDLGQRWRLFAGARLVRVEAASWRSDGSRALRFTQSAATPWLALTYTYAPNSLVYVSANRGFEVEAVPNRPALFTNAGQLLPAARSTQAEIGWRGELTPAARASLALFEIRRPHSDDRAVSPDAAGATLERVAGGREARHRGLELDGHWRFARQWSAAAQVALLEAVLERTLDPAAAGRRATNVPRAAGAAQLDWQRADRGLTVSNRIALSGSRAITADNAVTLPSWWQWDLWLSSTTRVGDVTTTWRAGVRNLTDRAYWREAPTTAWGGTYLFPAQPRSLFVGVSALL